ncbi:MAG: peroxiredoxin [Firmicutes bacterium]|nr:peroxiredoxin [Alicyclobacillaceae bacterium]MCL6496201.1 peroxiredoxin [Bacillota bacterium]
MAEQEAAVPEAAVKEGDLAPDFTLEGTGGPWTLSRHRGRPVVLYFYPRDNTPGCTTEACDFRDQLDAFRRWGAEVVGISTDSLKSHQNFAAKYRLPFPLLSDPDATVAARYGVWREKMQYGKPRMGIERTTFLIDSEGRIRAVWRKVKVNGHVEAVAARLAELLAQS